MRGIKFKLQGKTAFFKQPDVNTYVYFSYGCIHKIALLGIFGAIMGYGGYSEQSERKTEYPEFYEKFQDMKVAIIPQNAKGYVPKKVQSFNNSVGYASKEEGGNLIIKEQWLENPSWEIFFPVTDDQSEALAQRLLESRFVYLPYLGKNDHPAVISEVRWCEYTVEQVTGGQYQINSLFPKAVGSLTNPNLIRALKKNLKEEAFKYQERLPVALEKTQNQYITAPLRFTNWAVNVEMSVEIYKVEDENYILI